MKYRVGVDIGGTFTDVVFLGENGAVLTAKHPSTPDDYSLGIADGIAAVFREHGVTGGQITEVLHGTTIATNAILEKRGATTALITTEGFADILEIRRLRMPLLYDLAWRKPETLVKRAHRLEVRERIDHRGAIERPLDETHADGVVDAALDVAGVEALAVCLLNSYANGIHERRVRDLIRQKNAEIPICLSSEILPEIKEYERTSTTVVNAYIQPVVGGYLRALEARLRQLGIDAPILVMQSNGGAMGVEAASARPIHIIESGPAAGVVGAAQVINRLGHADALTFDMGGTTAKASIIEDGAFNRVGALDVGGGINLSGRLLTGGGYHVRVPAIDIAEVGAGGGSLLVLDAGGGVKVGPESAGADPGPVCYGRGNETPTVTDANVVLGYISPSHLVGGALTLDYDKAAAAVHDRLAVPLGVSLEAAAYGAHIVANATMARALRAVSSDRGRDPREFSLIAFGGSGSVHAASLCASLDIAKILVPPVSGVFSALGLLFPATEHHYVQTHKQALTMVDLDVIEALFQSCEAEGLAVLSTEGYGAGRVAFSRFVDLRYAGENSELTLPYEAGPEIAAGLRDAFDRAHERAYGYNSKEETVDLINIRVIATGLSDVSRVPAQLDLPADRPIESKNARRRAYFGSELGWVETQVVGRQAVGREDVEGPLIIEEYDCTIVVPPAWRVRRDDWDVLVMTVAER